jgi:hypothetical protein
MKKKKDQVFESAFRALSFESLKVLLYVEEDLQGTGVRLPLGQ